MWGTEKVIFFFFLRTDLKKMRELIMQIAGEGEFLGEFPAQVVFETWGGGQHGWCRAAKQRRRRGHRDGGGLAGEGGKLCWIL